MALITDVLTNAARLCSVAEPSSWLSETRQTWAEIRDNFLPDTVDEILERVDLPSPIGKQQVITGDGTESYALNADFKRLARDPLAVYETTTVRRAGIPLVTDGQWTHLNQIGSAAGSRFYKIEGYEGNYTIHFYRNPTTSDSITVSYVSDLWMADSGGTPGSAFTDAGDVLLLPKRIIELGVVWRFRRRKGLDYEDVLAEFEAKVERMITDMRGRRVVSFGGADMNANPMRVPVPDYIPSA